MKARRSPSHFLARGFQRERLLVDHFSVPRTIHGSLHRADR